MMVYIKVGRLMSRNVVKKLLRAVPSEDLKGLKSICVRTVPHKATKKRNKKWGGICGQYDESKVWIYLWGITQHVLKRWRYPNSNPYDSFTQKFARVLYHEIGHHVHSKTEEGKAADAWVKKTEAKMRRMSEKMKTTLLNENVARVYMDEFRKIMDEIRKIRSLKDKIEDFAEKYAEVTLRKARQMNLLEPPRPSEIRFFNMMRNKYIDKWFRIYEEAKLKGNCEGVWITMLGIFDHLRKCKLGNGVKYNLNELCKQVYGKYLTKDKNRRALKKFVLKHVEPVWYVSKTGRRYPYFTKAHVQQLISILEEKRWKRPYGWIRFVPRADGNYLGFQEDETQQQPMINYLKKKTGKLRGLYERGGGELGG